MEAEPPTVEAFVRDARAFLDAHAEHRPDGFPDAMFAQFREIADPEAFRARCVGWQRLLYDNGFAGLTWPRDVGGRALPSAYALAWADLEAEYQESVLKARALVRAAEEAVRFESSRNVGNTRR